MVIFLLLSVIPLKSGFILPYLDKALASSSVCRTKQTLRLTRLVSDRVFRRSIRTRMDSGGLFESEPGQTEPGVNSSSLRKPEGVKQLNRNAPTPPSSRIASRLRKPSGATSVVPEFSRPARLVPHDIAALSRTLRAGGAALIPVDVSGDNEDDEDGGYADLAAFAAEQAGRLLLSIAPSPGSSSRFPFSAMPSN